jgi:hypothetical protein
MSPRRKLEVIKEAKESGSVPKGALLSDYMNTVQTYLENNPPPEYYDPATAQIEVNENFPMEDYVKTSTSRNPREIVESIKTERPFGEGGSQVLSFAEQLNQAGYPYKAVVNKATETGYGLGFAKGIDRYEKASNVMGDLFLKYYTDGTYDTLDKATFDKEKGFNLLPPSIKEKYSTMVDLGESST